MTHGDRLALQRRVLRLGKPPRRWRRPPWAAAAKSEPQEVCLIAKPLTSTIGALPAGVRCCCSSCSCAVPAHASIADSTVLQSNRQPLLAAVWSQLDSKWVYSRAQTLRCAAQA